MLVCGGFISGIFIFFYYFEFFLLFFYIYFLKYFPPLEVKKKIIRWKFLNFIPYNNTCSSSYKYILNSEIGFLLHFFFLRIFFLFFFFTSAPSSDLYSWFSSYSSTFNPSPPFHFSLDVDLNLDLEWTFLGSLKVCPYTATLTTKQTYTSPCTCSKTRQRIFQVSEISTPANLPILLHLNNNFLLNGQQRIQYPLLNVQESA